MKRIKLVVAYDGTDYCGWQVQPTGQTVEGVLNQTLSELLREDIVVIGASRTDSGVHALGNVAVFDTNTRIPAEKISFALNTRLPDTIKIQDSCEVDKDFHPRHCVSFKTYEYRILNSKFPLPTNRLYANFIYRPLDIEAMQKACQYLIGEHDFKSFCSAKTQVLTTVRTIYELSVSSKDSDTGLENNIDTGLGNNIDTGFGNEISIRVKGSGFLYNMVRIIAGTLIEVGLHVYEPEHVKEILEGKDRSLAGDTAPACGLTLKKIEYL
ncbi:tRNA pseudouridine synthase A [Lachnospiraceae bacterium TWA4]|nr:tRNA pseudouridine synthase A [Lachnospiraceae bacterium TWA4]